jgi:hypothetical protein
MPEESAPVVESLGWRAGLPDDLKQNEAIVPFKTVGDFAKDYLDVKTKATELEGKLGNYVPKLPDNATDAERNLYFDALGRPKSADEYKLGGDGKNAVQWDAQWKQNFHSLGLTQSQAAGLDGMINTSLQAVVDAHNAKLQGEYKTAETALKTEWGSKYDTNVELAKRLYSKQLGSEFDKDFAAGTDATRLSTIKMLVKMASLTGEDNSPQSTQRPTVNGVNNPYPKSNMPPAKGTSFSV